MAKPKKNKFFSYRVLGVTLENWLIWFMVLVLFGFFVLVYYAIFYEYGSPPESEKMVAQVEQMWTDGPNRQGRLFYYLQLKQDEEEETCSVPPELNRLFLGLELGKTYEFSISRSRTRCSVYGAVEVEQ